MTMQAGITAGKTEMNRAKSKFAVTMMSLTLLPLPHVTGQLTAFTYQGRLEDGGTPASGSYDFIFEIFDDETGGTSLGIQTNAAIAVTGGFFAVTVDYGAGMFNGDDRWLEIHATTHAGQSFALLAPRQKVTATPYAIAAGNLLDVLPSSNLSGTYSDVIRFDNPMNYFAGDGGALSNLDARTVNGLDSSLFWQLRGNEDISAGLDFLGTSDDQPLEFRVNDKRALRLELNEAAWVPNIIGGFHGNQVSTNVQAATIGGGGAAGFPNRVLADFGTVGGGYFNTAGGQAATVSGGENNAAAGAGTTVGGGEGNRASNTWATVGGGLDNIAAGSRSTVSGGSDNVATNHWTTIAGGIKNTASGSRAAVGGGVFNVASDFYATVSGGANNVAGGFSSTVPGGIFNTATGDYAFAAGRQAKAIHTGSFVWADSDNSDFSSDRENQFKIRAAGGVHVVARSAGLFPAACKVESTTGDGVAILATHSSSASTVVLVNESTGDIIRGYSGGSGSNLVFQVLNDGAVGVGRTPAANELEVEGNVSKTTAGDWLANSDARIKTEVVQITNGLAIIDRLRPVKFRYTEAYRKTHPSIDDCTYYNFVAQEYAQVFPDSVRGDGTGLLQVDTYPVRPYMVAAVRELREQNVQLQRQNKELNLRLVNAEARIAEILSQIDALSNRATNSVRRSYRDSNP
jgi:hypothetical protein